MLLLKQGHPVQVFWNHIQACFGDLHGGDSTVSLVNLCYCSITYTIQKCFLMFRCHLLCSSLTIASCPVNGHHWKDPGSSLHPSIRDLFRVVRFTLKESLSFSWHARFFRSLIILMVPPWTLSSVSLCLTKLLVDNKQPFILLTVSSPVNIYQRKSILARSRKIAVRDIGLTVNYALFNVSMKTIRDRKTVVQLLEKLCPRPHISSVNPKCVKTWSKRCLSSKIVFVQGMNRSETVSLQAVWLMRSVLNHDLKSYCINYLLLKVWVSAERKKYCRTEPVHDKSYLNVNSRLRKLKKCTSI